MNSLNSILKGLCMTVLLYCMVTPQLKAQTDMDAIMLKKKIFCVGAMYSHDSWDEYWEGTFKRSALNMGTVSTQMIGIMGNYGITDKLNVLFSAPYVKTKATRGTLKGLDGVQDLALMLKYKVYEKKFSDHSRLSTYAVGRVSMPLTNYAADFVPLSIGLRSKTAGIRGMIDYQYKTWFVTGSGAYTFRSNIKIDRTAYYTTEMHYTREVEMYDGADYNVRLGYRSKRWVAEGIFADMYTLGGFDIRKNDMSPFPSNRMNMRRVGASFKYSFQNKLKGLELTGGAMYTVHGRNVGQSTTINGGVFYLMNLSSRNKPRSSQQQN